MNKGIFKSHAVSWALLGMLFAESAGAGEKYVVVRGDTLWDVAAMIYDDPFQWTKIYEANKLTIKNPDRIYPEQMILVTSKTGEVIQIKVMPKEDPAPAPAVPVKEEPAAPVLAEAPAAPDPEPVKAEEVPQDIKLAEEEPAVKEEKPSEEPAPQVVSRPRVASNPEFKEYDGRVIASRDAKKILLSQGDFVYVNLGAKDGLVEGDELWLVRKTKKVMDRKTRQPFWLVERRGKLKVTSEIYESRSECVIVFSHLTVDIGDGVLRAERQGAPSEN